MTTRLLTIQETAAELRSSRATVYRLFAAGELDFVQIGARRRVTAAEIDRFIAAHSRSGTPT
jgi:excisionase family DNA binding protein